MNGELVGWGVVILVLSAPASYLAGSPWVTLVVLAGLAAVALYILFPRKRTAGPQLPDEIDSAPSTGRVTGLSVACVAVRALVNHGRVFLVHDGTLAPPAAADTITFDHELFIARANEVSALLKSIPAFLDNVPSPEIPIEGPEGRPFLGQYRLRGLEAELRRLVGDATAILRSAARTTVHVDVLSPSDPLHGLLLRNREDSVPPGATRVSGIKNRKGEGMLRALETVFANRGAVGDAAPAVEMIRQMMDAADSKRRDSLLGTLVGQALLTARAANRRSYYYFCPYCHESGAKSVETPQDAGNRPDLIFDVTATMTCDAHGEQWTCRLCGRTASGGQLPIPVHRMLIDVFVPAYSKLLIENHVPRQEHYANIDAQKRDYAERARRAIDTAVDANQALVSSAEARMREAEALARGAAEAMTVIGAQLLRYEAIEQQAQKAYITETENVCRAIANDNRQRLQSFNAEVRFVLTDFNQAMDKHATSARVEQEVRDRVQQQILDVNRQVAQSVENVAAATQQIASNTARTAAATETSAAIQYAMGGGRDGVGDKPWYALGSHLDRIVSSVSSPWTSLAGSPLQKARRDMDSGVA